MKKIKEIEAAYEFNALETKERLAADVNKYKTLLAKTRSHEESKDLAFKLSLAEAKLKALNQKQAR